MSHGMWALLPAGRGNRGQARSPQAKEIPMRRKKKVGLFTKVLVVGFAGYATFAMV